MENTFLNVEILTQLGFIIKTENLKKHLVTLTKDKFEIVILDDKSVFYTNLGFYYPIKDLNGLKKLYKEVLRHDLY